MRWAVQPGRGGGCTVVQQEREWYGVGITRQAEVGAAAACDTLEHENSTIAQ